MFGLGVAEIGLIGVIAFFFLGPKKIPELAKGIGEGIGVFKKALKENQDV